MLFVTKLVHILRKNFTSETFNNVLSTMEKQRPVSKWMKPHDVSKPVLEIFNSLTKTKEKFIPTSQNKVSWYICGPTVYDSAHMGHARSYISFDILRRVLNDYFGYNVQYVMNITDIDDKIIKRSRQRHLLQDYLNKLRSVVEIEADGKKAVTHYELKIAKEADPDKKQIMMTMVDVFKKELSGLSPANFGIQESASKEVLSDWLDSMHGHELTDHSIFMNLAKKFEAEYHADMKALNILPPSVLTRVSEYVPEIVKYIDKIIDNGFAYEANGSVYFDTVKFDSDPEHYYAKLVPSAFGDVSQLQSAMAEGEGALSLDESRLQEKRNMSDFALWKVSKPGEPAWESPWSKGRPGWHIECSVMASDICGSVLDIHSGGFDLKFPHHDNEIAQSEAYFGSYQWINYFLHAGTLRIAGLKMSKSLKNFITIREALQQYTARQIRILFLMHTWSESLDYSASTMERAVQFEKLVNEFFLLVKHYLRTSFNPSTPEAYVKFEDSELSLFDKHIKAIGAIDAALCDSVDTRLVIEHIRALISDCNVYIRNKESSQLEPNCLLLRDISLYLMKLFKIFGLTGTDDEIGFPLDSGDGSATKLEEQLMPYLNVLAEFRDKVRNFGLQHKLGQLLEECDKLRDDALPELGVRLEDREGRTVMKLVNRETLLREKAQQEQLKVKLQEEKARKQKEQEEKEAAKRIPANQMFVGQTDKYGRFDDKGIPTHDVEGTEITKSQRKKLEKAYEAQEKKYQAFVKTQENASVQNGTA